MNGPLAAAALRTATMEMHRNKRPVRHVQSSKTLRMSLKSARSVAASSMHSLYHASRAKLNRLLRKDRFKNECRYCDSHNNGNGDDNGAANRHALGHVNDQGSTSASNHELAPVPPTNQGPTVRVTAQSRSTTPISDEDDSAGSRSRSSDWI